MQTEILPNADAVAKRAAAIVAEQARQAVSARGCFNVAFSGGHAPWIMLRDLTDEDIPWDKVQVFQIDERVAPAGDPDRNLTHLRQSLLGAPLRLDQIHPMPVELPELEGAAAQYEQTLRGYCGSPAVLDLAHLGLGPDGHTASLVPGDPVLNVDDRDVALTGVYMGRRRMTLTYPMINRSRRILWLVTGADKVDALKKLRAGDTFIPGARIARENAMLLAEQASVGATG
jgi:6-phosphogluconolactonase